MQIVKPASPERIDALINRLSARSRWTWAARIYGNWLAQLGRDTGDSSPPSPIRLWRYGGLLREAGDNVRAAEVFRELATLVAQKGTGPSFYLQRSFDEWARCLDASGLHQSAAATRALGRRAAARRKKEREEDGEQLRSLSPSRLIRPVAARITFIMSLEWDSTSEDFDLFVEDGFLTLRDRFRAGEPPGAWLEFEAKAPAERDPDYPHVAVCVKFPWRFVEAGDRQLALTLVNEMNVDNAACSTCLEPEGGQIAVRSRIGFAGYNDEAVEPLGDIAAAQEEANLNMFAEVLGMATCWAKRVAELSGRLPDVERLPHGTPQR
jgi:hypothetical protein